MIKFDQSADCYVVTSASDLVGSPLTNGGVFEVIATPRFMSFSGRCMTVNLMLIAQEGYGASFSITLANNQTESIPAQVELFLMDIDCVPTWRWSQDNKGSYHGQFANSRSMKAVRYSGAYNFPVTL